MTTNQLHIGMIGVSGRGGLWRHWHHPEGRSLVVAGADINPAYRQGFVEEHGGDPFVTDDYRRSVGTAGHSTPSPSPRRTIAMRNMHWLRWKQASMSSARSPWPSPSKAVIAFWKPGEPRAYA